MLEIYINVSLTSAEIASLLLPFFLLLHAMPVRFYSAKNIMFATLFFYACEICFSNEKSPFCEILPKKIFFFSHVRKISQMSDNNEVVFNS